VIKSADLVQTVVLAAPIVIAALAGIISERAGVFALGLEGFMLVGCFVAIWVGAETGSLPLAVLATLAAGALYGAVLAVAAIKFGADQLLAGVAINVLALGLTGYLQTIAWADTSAPVVRLTERIAIPGLSELPVVGRALFDQSIFVYLAFALVIATSLWLFRTRWGLVVRATGEMAASVETSGHSVARVRYLAVIASGMLAALGGAALALVQAQTFTNNMTAGRGFLALTVAVFARWRPGLALLGALLFGAVDTLQLRLQISSGGGSSYLIQTLPYVIAVVAIVLSGRAAAYPASIGIPYRRETR
jgi:general nucleoside transport system permease protein